MIPGNNYTISHNTQLHDYQQSAWPDFPANETSAVKQWSVALAVLASSDARAHRPLRMTVYRFNPLEDSRWPALVSRHPGASIFHTCGWAQALCRTYGYEPLVYTTCPPGSTLTNGILFCRINSWVTGRRLVSLPFSDHCEPLVDVPADRIELRGALQTALDTERCGYVELRPRNAGWECGSTEQGSVFVFHLLDLRPTLEELYQNCHKGSIQRKIRRAEREGLEFDEGTSEALLNRFYGLLVLTRKRHRLLPQPIEWFRNLVSCLNEHLNIRVASQAGRPVAAILTLQHGDTLVYKYGCSDAAYHSLGAVPALLWRAIEGAKVAGLQKLDLGRSDSDKSGLITFKDRWGAVSSTLTYVRCSKDRSRPTFGRMRIAKEVFGRLPNGLRIRAGTLLYRHIG